MTGNDHEQRATVWWRGAYEADSVAALLDNYRPTDRLACSAGGIAFVRSSEDVLLAAVGSADTDHWFLIPAPMMGAFELNTEHEGHLVMPTGLADLARVPPAQPFGTEQDLTGTPWSGRPDWSWAVRYCEN